MGDVEFSEKTIQKLGEALYIRNARKKQAEDAEKAVDYLTEEGILTDD